MKPIISILMHTLYTWTRNEWSKLLNYWSSLLAFDVDARVHLVVSQVTTYWQFYLGIDAREKVEREGSFVLNENQREYLSLIQFLCVHFLMKFNSKYTRWYIQKQIQRLCLLDEHKIDIWYERGMNENSYQYVDLLVCDMCVNNKSYWKIM